MSDFIAVLLCVIGSVIVGVYSSRGIETCRDFVIADRKFTTFTMVAAIFPLMVGSADLLGGTNGVCKVGLIFLTIGAGFATQAIMFVLVISKRIRNYTYAIFPGDIMRDGYGKRGQKIFGICTSIRAFGDVLTQFAAMDYICITFFKVDHPALCVFVICFAVTFYCALGGIKAVTLTDIFQLLVFVIAFPMIASIVLYKSGGVINIINNIPQEHLNIFDHHEFWKYIALFFWCLIPSDVGIMHRIMLSRDVEQANQALKISMFLFIPIFILMILFGFCSLAVFGNISDGAFSRILDVSLPYGFKGLAAAGLIAVSMSAFATNINLLAISFTRDTLKPFLKATISDKNELLIMRIATVVFAVVGYFVACRLGIVNIQCFDNVFTTVVFPSMIMLLMGFVCSRRAFLSGVVASITVLLLTVVFGNDDTLVYITWPIIALNIGIMYVVNKCKFTKNAGK